MKMMGRWFSVVMAVFALMAACSRKPAGPDLSRRMNSAKQVFEATITPERDPIPVNEIHSWKLHLARGDGAAVEGAQIRVDGLMPEHKHGMATQPRVTRELGGGGYLVEGVKLQMRGWWQVRFYVQHEGERDEITFNLMLD